MKKTIIKAFTLMGVLVLFASCVKEVVSNNELYRPEGTPIVFAAETGYDNGVETRTEYSGVTASVASFTNPFERINWVSGDKIKIYYANAGTTSVYSVGAPETPAAPELEKSKSGVSSSSPLQWVGGNDDNVFYGMYPDASSNSGHGANTSASLVNTVASGSIPPAQSVYKKSGTTYEADMAYGYLVSKKTIAGTSTARTVDLPFRPATTTFQFKFKLGSGAATNVESFVMSSSTDLLAGSFSFDMANGVDADVRTGSSWGNVNTNAPADPSYDGKSITVSFKNGTTAETPAVTSNGYLDFTVFALPVNITNVTLTFNFVGGTSKSLKLKTGTDLNTGWENFTACRKYIITNDFVPGTDEWDYYIDAIDDVTKYGHAAITATNVFTYQVKSYKVKRGTTTKVEVPWHMEYSTDEGVNWSETWPSGSPFTSANITSSGAGSNGTTHQDGYTTLPTESTGSTSGDAGDATRAALATADPRGTAENPFDLSMHPCYGNKDATTSQNTANCYIVSAPGYYKFPLVYGNAIKNGVDNVISYAPESVTHIFQTYKDNPNESSHLVYQAHFHNAVNKDIKSPYILTDLGNYGGATDLDVAIIWQDVPTGYEIIPYDNPTIVGSGSSAYIKFSITADDIQQGNVVIALRGKVIVPPATVPTKEILWSWHIWVTEKDLDPVVVNHAVNSSSEMAQYNLGWTDKTNAQSTKYPDRKLSFKVVQNEKPASASTYLSEDFTFKQIGDATYTPDNIGSNAFYQWGRKDPFLTAAGANQNKQCSTGEGYTITSDNVHLVQQALDGSGDPDFGYGIRHPYVMIKNSWSTGWVGGSGHVGTTYTEEQRQNSSIAYNLWSAYVRGQHDKSNYNGAKAKTVYDPCPPGFEVPSKNAFMGFVGCTGDDEAPNDLTKPRKGTPGPDGFNFYRNGSSGATIYLPYCGARGYEHTEIYDVTNTGYYWTDAPDKSTYPGPGGGSDHTGWRMSKLLYFNKAGEINAHYDLYKGAAYAIRPVLESVQHVNSDISTGGMEGNTYDFNDGWTIN